MAIKFTHGLRCRWFKLVGKKIQKKRKSLLIGTPHYGEAKRLLGKDFIDRFLVIKKIKEKYGGRWILKGPGTLILNKNFYVNNFANSILATAGSGDVLAGNHWWINCTEY